MSTKIFCFLVCGLLVFGALAACSDGTALQKPPSKKLARELIFYDWADDLPQSVLDAFTAEYGVKVIYQTFQSTEEALQNLRAGKVADVTVIENHFIPELATEGLLAEIDYRNVPNFKHIAPGFRDLVFDPGNRYSITFNWGLTGLLERADLTSRPVAHWADLWDQRYKNQVKVWELQRNLIGIALKSLGYSINSENPVELEAAMQRLLTLRAAARVSGYTPNLAEQVLTNGETVLIYGWGADMLRMRSKKVDVRYVLPPEGSIQWGDNFVIPQVSPHKYTAEVFINFLMRPEINARIVNEQHYATANESAYPFIEPAILNDPIIFPSIEDVKKAEVFMPLSKEGKVLHDRIWQRFLSGSTDGVKGATDKPRAQE